MQLLAAAVLAASPSPQSAPPLKVLFLGDQGHHQPRARHAELAPALAAEGIELEYTEDLERLSVDGLAGKDALLVYANIDELGAERGRALSSWIRGGKGLAAIHCASFCFRDSEEYVRLVGAQFSSHGWGRFTTDLVGSTHEGFRGFLPFEGFDETYVHARHGSDRRIVEVRRDGGHEEPWTWTRDEGAGRVFYTAWGHDERTWTHPGFHDLVERGLRWAAGSRFVEARAADPFVERVEARVPLYKEVAGSREQGTMPKPLSAEESRKLMHVASGFEVDLVASEPRIGKPLAMAFDPDGRLWLCETLDYPNELQPAGSGRDRLRVLVDEDGDGSYEKDVVYADKLSIPTSLCFTPEGVVVHQAPHTLLLVDSDGDLRCDERRVLFSGWGVGDTHAGPSNMQLGFDGWIWGVVGYSGFSGVVGGKQLSFGQGVYRFKPDGSELQFLGSTTNNTWGLGLSEEGEIFASTANHDVMMHLSLANPVKERVKGVRARAVEPIHQYERMHPVTDAVRQVDWFGMYTAAAGARVYAHRSFPRRFWNSAALVCEPTGHLVHASLLERDGAGWKALDGGSLLASRDEWFAPIAAEVAPSGAVYVLDWYNYIVQHNPTPQGFENGAGNAYETPLRDKVHARIWRLKPKGAQSSRERGLSGMRAGELVAALGSPDLQRRLHAQARLVASREPQVDDLLRAAAADEALDGIGNAPLVLHAIHALAQRGAFRRDEATSRQLVGLLRHKAPAVRAAAARLLSAGAASTRALLAAGLLEDEMPMVRREACVALAMAPSDEVVGAELLRFLSRRENHADRRIADAAQVAVGVHPIGFLSAALDARTPADVASGGLRPRVNLLPNPGFEDGDGDGPRGWRLREYSGAARWRRIASGGRDGGACVEAWSAEGADSSLHADVRVEGDARYELSGWVRTEGIEGAMGALLNAHAHPDATTDAVQGTNSWRRVSVELATFPGQDALSINLLLGGWGRASGRAWWDDVSLVKVDESGPVGALNALQSRALDIAAANLLEREPDSVARVVDHLHDADPAVRLRLLSTFAREWPRGRGVAGLRTEALERAGVDLDDDSAAALLSWLDRAGEGDRLAGMRGELAARAAAIALDEARPVDQRLRAADRWLVLDAAEAGPSIALLLCRAKSPELVAGLAGALESVAGPRVGGELAAGLADAGDAARRAALELLLRRDAWHALLLEALESGRLPRGEVRADDRRKLLAGADDAERARIERLLGASNPARGEVLARVAPAASMRGDAVRGRTIHQQKCAVCHRFGGEGGEVGPALDGMGKHPASELLAEIVDPNRSVEANYRLWLLETTDEVVVSGRLVEENERYIELLDAGGKRLRLERAEIAAMKRSDSSVMPEGLVDDLPLEDIAALLAFLATDGGAAGHPR